MNVLNRLISTPVKAEQVNANGDPLCYICYDYECYACIGGIGYEVKGWDYICGPWPIYGCNSTAVCGKRATNITC